MQIEIHTAGSVLRKIHHQDKCYLKAPPSGEYEISLYNDSPHRVEAVVSVDGLSVMNGKPCGHDDRGYVIEPWSRFVVPGWRRTDTEVAHFSFGAREQSYSSQMGHGTKNLGVIGDAQNLKPSITISSLSRSVTPASSKSLRHLKGYASTGLS